MFGQWSLEPEETGVGRAYFAVAVAFLSFWIGSALFGSDLVLLLTVLGVPLPFVGMAISLNVWLDDKSVSAPLLGTALSGLPAAALMLTIFFWPGCE